MWTKLRQMLWQWRSLWIITPSVAGLIILLRFSGLLQFLEWAAFDQYMRLRPQELPDDRVVIVGGANDGGYVRANANKYQVILNYRGTTKHFHSVSMRDVLQDRLPADWGRDRIILIGNVGEIFEDFVFSPFNSGFPLGIERTPRVEIHANQISQILSSVIDDRPLIKTWSEPLEWLWILLWSGVGANLIWQLRYIGGLNKVSFHKVIAPFLAAIALSGMTFLAFLGGWWIPVVPPLFALGGSAIALTAYLAHTAGAIRKTFGRYLTNEVVANLLENPDGLKLGGERRNITILTSDLRGFTAISERLPAEEVIKIINLYLGYMADVITQYQGTIDEFMGDGILVLFGAPTAREDDAIRAIACAVAMQLAMEPVNETMQQLGLPHLEMGIGINTGEVVVGNIGSEKRSKYGIVGDQVNLTYRIESYSVGGQILISESTFKQVESLVKIDVQKSVQPKGVHQPITIYEIGGISGKYNLYLPNKEEEVFVTLPETILLQYTPLDGKHIDSSIMQGRLSRLSLKAAEICVVPNQDSVVLAPLTNLKLNLFMPNDETFSEDIYAKVVEPAKDNSFYIHFTNKPPEIEKQLSTLYNSIKTTRKIP